MSERWCSDSLPTECEDQLNNPIANKLKFVQNQLLFNGLYLLYYYRCISSRNFHKWLTYWIGYSHIYFIRFVQCVIYSFMLETYFPVHYIITRGMYPIIATHLTNWLQMWPYTYHRAHCPNRGLVPISVGFFYGACPRSPLASLGAAKKQQSQQQVL